MIRLAFAGDASRFQRFAQLIREAIPAHTTVVLRGSAVTGHRWKTAARCDAKGPGTSDLDLTLIGERILSYYKPSGFFVPDVHFRPLSDADPDIAPALVPLRRALINLVDRPVNIQGTRDAVMCLRGDLLGPPHLTLIAASA